MGIRIKDLQSGSPLPNDFMAFDGDGGTRKATVGAVIGAVSSNRNLFDNPWFTINQRNVSGSLSNGYTVDRWQANINGGSITYNQSDHSMAFGATSNTDYLIQPIESAFRDELHGKVVTFSVLENNAIKFKTFTFDKNARDSGVSIPNANVKFWYGGSGEACIQHKTSTTSIIKAVKLELGSASTLANDVAPDYAEELLKCQRYFYRLGGKGIGLMMVACFDTGNAYGVVQFPVTMRATPTFASSAGNTMNVMQGGAAKVSTAIVLQLLNPQTAEIRVSATGLTQNASAWLRTVSSGGYIEFSADL